MGQDDSSKRTPGPLVGSRVAFRSVVDMTTSFDVSEDEISIQGAEGLNLKIKGRIPDKWAMYVMLLLASFLGLDQLGVLGP